MKITIKLTGQLKTLAGSALFTCTVDEGTSAHNCVVTFVKNKGGDFEKASLSNETLDPCVLIFCDDQQVFSEDSVLLKEGSQILLMLPIAGG